MTTTRPYSRIVLPDDPPANAVGPLEPRLRLLTDELAWHRDVPATEEELVRRVKDADAIISSRATVRFTRSVQSACPGLKIIARAGAGVDHIELAAARDLGVTVTNSPGCGTPYVAEHALTLALAVSRQIVLSDRHIREGGWTRSFINELYGKTLGVVGTGAIGQRLIQLGRGIGMEVIAWTLHPSPQRAAQYGVEFVPLEDLLRRADVVSLHVELSPLTRQLLGREQLALLKPTAILVNTARGGVVDEAALLEALEQGKIAGAGLDVFETEPLPAGHPLTRLDNVVLTCHQGLLSRPAVHRAFEMALEALEAFAAGQPIHVVAWGRRR